MRAWFLYLLMILNALFALANLYFGVNGHLVNLLAAVLGVGGSGLMFYILNRSGWPAWNEEVR